MTFSQRNSDLKVQVHTVGHLKKGGVLSSIEVNATFIEEIKAGQFGDENLKELKDMMVNGKAQKASFDADGVLSV